MTQLEGTENRIATERGRYVQAVQEYNLIVRQFPTLITAKIFGYDTIENYGVSRQDEITKDPEVKFSVPESEPQPAKP
jgi:LemA protein